MKIKLFVALLSVLVLLTACTPQQPNNNSNNNSTSTPTPTVSDSDIDFTIEASDFQFSLEEIEVNAGDTVTIRLVGINGTHNFVIDDLNVNSDFVSGGSDTIIQFTVPASASGQSFEYYCSLSNHHALGMKGTLVVK